jgi:hypothetical protein
MLPPVESVFLQATNSDGNSQASLRGALACMAEAAVLSGFASNCEEASIAMGLALPGKVRHMGWPLP